MEDKQIVDLYWERSEQAIPETEKKYGAYCYSIAQRILNVKEDSEECVNDTWLGAWNSMPENRPSFLAPYLAKLTRWLSLSRLREKNRLKRGGGEATLAWEELNEQFDSGSNVERDVELKELTRILNEFLHGLDKQKREIFLARYWHMASIGEIAQMSGFSEGKIKTMLFRLRQKLWTELEGQGYVE